MRAALFILACMLESAPLTGAQALDAQTEAAVLAADQQYRDAMLTIDEAKLDSVLAADFRMLHGDGQSSNRTELLHEFHSWEFGIYQREVVEWHAYGSAVLLVSRTLKGGNAHPQRYWTSEIFIQ